MPARSTAKPGLLVLIADDNDDNRDLYKQFLVFAGFRVAEAADGEEALRQAAYLAPDAIVMDLSMPKVDGWEATRRLKADPTTRAIPVLALTGHALDKSKQAAAEAGCDAYLTKPLLPELLVQAIRGLIKK